MPSTKDEEKREWLVITKQGNFVFEATRQQVTTIGSGNTLAIFGDDGVMSTFQEWTAVIDVNAVKRCELRDIFTGSVM